MELTGVKYALGQDYSQGAEHCKSEEESRVTLLFFSLEVYFRPNNYEIVILLICALPSFIF